MRYSLSNIRISVPDKNYWLRQFQIFADKFDPEQIRSVCFGKQDTRGGISITRCLTISALHFASKDAMPGYVAGFNDVYGKNLAGHGFSQFSAA